MIRDLLLGRSRFRDFAASPEGIPTNVLSDRLARLVEHGIAERAALDDAPQTLGYRLTKKGAALRPLVEMLRDWGLRWEPGTQVRLRPRS